MGSSTGLLLMVRLPCGETPPRARKAAASTGPSHAMSCAPSRRPMLRPSECTRLPAADTDPEKPWRFNLTRIPHPMFTTGLNEDRPERFLGESVRTPRCPRGHVKVPMDRDTPWGLAFAFNRGKRGNGRG